MSASAREVSTGVVLTDCDGANVPFQIVESTRYADGGLKTARVAFIAGDVPALGYSTYHVRARHRMMQIPILIE